MHKLLKSFLVKRKSFNNFGGNESDWKRLKEEVLQGSLLGPQLFLVYIYK